MDELFKMLEKRTGVPCDEARLIHAGKELVQKQGKRISDYPAIVHGSTLFMVMRLYGGTQLYGFTVYAGCLVKLLAGDWTLMRG